MSNLPQGAENDPYAPYNIKEETFKFSAEIIGEAWFEYYGTLDIEEAIQTIKGRIAAALDQIGDINIKRLDFSCI